MKAFAKDHSYVSEHRIAFKCMDRRYIAFGTQQGPRVSYKDFIDKERIMFLMSDLEVQSEECEFQVYMTDD